MMRPKAQIKDLPVYQPGKPIDEVKREYNLTEVIKLASNENPFGASPDVQEAIQQEALKLTIYPDGASYDLRHKLAQFYGVKEDQLIFGNGSDEIISFVTRAFLDENSQTVMATPSFPIYKTNALIEGAEAVEVPLKDGVHDLERMKEAITEQTKVVWICNPNNPTGTYVNEASVLKFLQDVPEHVLVVLDEAYYEYVSAKDYPHSLELLDQFSNLFIMRTFSKAYGLASLRIGYGIGSTAVIDLLNRVRGPFNTNRIAQAAAVTALDDQEYVQYCHEMNLQGQEKFYKACAELGLSYYPTEGNFILIDVQRNGNDVFEALLRQGIIVRSGQALGFPTSIRVTIGSEEQNRKVIAALERIVKGAS